MYSLFIDTHYKEVVIVLFKNGVYIDKRNKESIQHSVFVMPLINEILINNSITINNINEIIVVNGPGSFTGVRIGVTIAKVLAYTLKCDIKSIDSLLIQEISSKDNDNIMVVQDQNGYYYGHFKNKELIEDYKYLKKNEFIEYINNNNLNNLIKNEIIIDYNLVYNYLKNKKVENVHKVNPLYIKNIEV